MTLLRWFRKKPETEDRRSPAERMTTLRRADVYYLPITKCGSTYLKNLFHYLDSGEEHESGADIHHAAGALWKGTSEDEAKIASSPHAFTVLRDPVDRFASLYFDKIWGDGPRNFEDVRQLLAEQVGLDLSRDLDAAAHRENCRKLIDWLALNLDFQTEEPVNPHWRRQSSRLKRVEGLNLKHLTLDGLDWQLPVLIGEVVPDIREAMQSVKERNRIPRPFSNTDLMDDALRARIEDVYSTDVELYRAARQEWEPWRDLVPADNTHINVMTAKGHPIYCVTVNKCGRTYQRNMLHILETGEEFDDPMNIHTPEVTTTLKLTRDQLRDGVSYFVVRDPVDRFFSLYFEKVIGKGPNAFPWVAERLKTHRVFHDGDNLTIDQHRENCDSLLKFVAFRIRRDKGKVNPHWKPQFAVTGKAALFGMTPILLSDFRTQLVQVANGRIAGLEAVLQSMEQHNRSEKPVSKDDILTPEFADRIRAVYPRDQALYQRVREGWLANGQPPKLVD